MAKRTATTKTTIKAPKITQALRLRIKDLGTTTVDAPTINDTNPEGTVKRNRPRRGFEPQLPETLQERIPTGTTPSKVTTTGEERQEILDNSLGRVDRTTALKARFGKGGKKDGERLPGGNKTDDIPGFDQGFDGKPSGNDLQLKAGDLGGTPMDPFRGGSVGGPLGDLANAHTKTLEDFNRTSDIATEPQGGGEKKNGSKDGKEGETFPGPTSGANANVDPSTGEVSAHKPVTLPAEGSFFDRLKKLFFGETKLDGTKTTRQEALDQAMLEIPRDGGNVDVNIITGTLLEQLQAAQAGRPTRQGGGGDATPVDDGGIGGVVRDGFIAPNQGSINGRNLFGQPGGNAIGENVSGGNKGLSDFGQSNGPGTINPGPEGGDPAGDPRFAEDPGAALGDGKPGPSFPGNDDTDGTGATGNDQNQGNDPITGSKLASGGGLVIADGFQPRTLDAITAFLATQPQPAPGTVPTAKPELVLPQPQTFVSKELFSTAPLIGSVGPTEPATTKAPFGEPVLTSVFGPSTFLQARTTSSLLLA